MSKNRKNKMHNQFKDAVLLNSATYFDYLERFKKIALSMFEWVNLPDSMDSRFLEKSLYYMGQASLLYDENYGFINTKCNSNGNINIYDLPSKLNCYSVGYNTTRETYVGFNPINESKTDEAILVMNTMERVPTASTLELFAERLTEIQRSIDINIKQLKYPRLIGADGKTIFTLRQVINQIDDNELNIYLDKNILTPDGIRTIDNEVPFVADKLTEQKKEIWNEFLTFMGISNLDTKKERLIASEGDSKNEVINMNLQSYLVPRKLACKQFNEKFGMNIDVKVRSDLHNLVKEVENSFSDIKESVSDEIVDDALNKEGK